MDLGLIRRLGSLRRPRSLSRSKKCRGIEDAPSPGVKWEDDVVRLQRDQEPHPPPYIFRFKPGDLVKPKEVIDKGGRIWLVKQNYVSERKMKCAEVFDTAAGEYGYFLEIELEFVDEKG